MTTVLLYDYVQLRRRSHVHRDHVRAMSRAALSHAMAANRQTHPLPALVQTREASSAMASLAGLYGHERVSECLGVDATEIHERLAARELAIVQHISPELWPAKGDTLWQLYMDL